MQIKGILGSIWKKGLSLNSRQAEGKKKENLLELGEKVNLQTGIKDSAHAREHLKQVLSQMDVSTHVFQPERVAGILSGEIPWRLDSIRTEIQKESIRRENEKAVADFRTLSQMKKFLGNREL